MVQIVELALDQVFAHPENPRSVLGDLRELSASIAAQGVIAPVTVVPVEGGHRLVAGHRRAEAARMAGLSTVPAIVREDMGEAQQLEVMLVENVQREGLSVMEQAKGLARLVELGLTQREIAARTGIAQGTVSKRLALLVLPTSVAAKVDSGGISVKDAEVIAKVAKAEDDAMVKAVTNLVERGRTAEDAVRQAEADRRRLAKLDGLRKRAEKAGWRDLGDQDPSKFPGVNVDDKDDVARHEGHIGYRLGFDTLRAYCTKPRAHRAEPSSVEDPKVAEKRARDGRRAVVEPLGTARWEAAKVWCRKADARKAGDLLTWFMPLVAGLGEGGYYVQGASSLVGRLALDLLGAQESPRPFDDAAAWRDGKPVERARLAAAVVVALLDQDAKRREDSYVKDGKAAPYSLANLFTLDLLGVEGVPALMPKGSAAVEGEADARVGVEPVEPVEGDDQGDDDDQGDGVYVCGLIGHGYHDAEHPCPGEGEPVGAGEPVGV